MNRRLRSHGTAPGTLEPTGIPMDPTRSGQSDAPSQPGPRPWAWFRAGGLPFGWRPGSSPAIEVGQAGVDPPGGGLQDRPVFSWLRRPIKPVPASRLLFLDDDPLRAELFLRENPHAVWVTTVGECVARLDDVWDEVHLDHDLGGKTFVDSSADDCGMEVIRWLCKGLRGHLKDTLFFVH